MKLRTYPTLAAFVAVTAALSVPHLLSGPPEAQRPALNPSSAARSIIVQNSYYAEPGKAEDLYRGLVATNELRGKLGLHQARLLRRTERAGDAFATPADHREEGAGAEELPDVVGQFEYVDAATREREFKTLLADPDYQTIHERFMPFTRRLQRATYESAATVPSADHP